MPPSDITYRTEVGLIFKDVLEISPEGARWKKAHYPLDKITRTAWGATKTSVNFIPMGTDYTVAFGDNKSIAVCRSLSSSAYEAFTEKLSLAVGARLTVETLQRLKDGQTCFYGDIQVDDLGVTLTRPNMLFNSERVRFEWDWDTFEASSQNGRFYVGTSTETFTNASASYIGDANTHIIQHILRLALINRCQKLSDLL